jgi:hypothetical protein
MSLFSTRGTNAAPITSTTSYYYQFSRPALRDTGKKASWADRDQPRNPDQKDECFQVFTQDEYCFKLDVIYDPCFSITVYSQSDPNNPQKTGGSIWPSTPDKIEVPGFTKIYGVHVQSYLYVYGVKDDPNVFYLAKFMFIPGIDGGIGAITNISAEVELDGTYKGYQVKGNDTHGNGDIYLFNESQIFIYSSIDLSLINVLSLNNHGYYPHQKSERFLTREYYEQVQPYPTPGNRWMKTLEKTGGMHIDYDVPHHIAIYEYGHYNIDPGSFFGFMEGVWLTTRGYSYHRITKTFDIVSARLPPGSSMYYCEAAFLTDYDEILISNTRSVLYADGTDYIVWDDTPPYYTYAGKVAKIGQDLAVRVPLPEHTQIRDVSLYNGCVQYTDMGFAEIQQIIL